MLRNPSLPFGSARPAFLPVAAACAPAVAAGKWQFRWLCFTLLSFCYELPLARITSYDRVDPRLFDIATILGVFLVLPTIRVPAKLPPVFRRWLQLVLWFAFCGVLWAFVWLPWDEAGKFTIYYVIRYLQGLFVIFLAACLPLDSRQKRLLQYAVLVGGLVVAIYAIPEYIRGGTVRQISDEKAFQSPPGSVLSCLGSTYFHVAMLAPMACVVTLALVDNAKRRLWSWGLFGTAIILLWPALVCGSRAGIFAAAIILIGAFIAFKSIRARFTIVGVLALLIIAGGFVYIPALTTLSEKSLGLRRLLTLEGRGEASIEGRIGVGADTYLGTDPLKPYEWQGWRLWVFGGGFYAVPRLEDGELFYRCGYGLHNIYLFPLEQGGVPALVMFFLFLWTVVKELRAAIRRSEKADKDFAKAIAVFFAAVLMVGPAGQVFWQGFGTENFNTCILVMLVLATKPTGSTVLPNSPARTVALTRT